MDYTIRFLTLSDMDMILEMNDNYWNTLADYDTTVNFLSSSNNFILAAVKEDTVIGFAHGYRLNRLSGSKDMVYIHAIEVMETYRRQGVANKIFTNLKSYCGKNDIHSIFLTCYQNNIPANELYRKLGGTVPKESNGNDTVYWFNIK